MTTTQYLVSKGYSDEEIEAIMQEIQYYDESQYLYDAEAILCEIPETEFDDIPF